MTAEEAAAHNIGISGLDYPEFRPDLDYQGLLARAEVLFATRIPPDVITRAPRLRWIQFTSAGVDQLWQPSLGDANIAVTTTRGIHAYPMAEFVMSCVLAFAKVYRGCSGSSESTDGRSFSSRSFSARRWFFSVSAR